MYTHRAPWRVTRWLAALFLLLVLSAYGQRSPNGPPGPVGNPTPPNNGRSPNGPPGPVGNPTPPNNGNNENRGTAPPTPTPAPPGSSEGRADPVALAKLRLNLFDPSGNIDRTLLVPAILATTNVSALSSTMSQTAEIEATAILNLLSQRMSQLQNAAYGVTNLFLYDVESNRQKEQGKLKLGVWLTGSEIISQSSGTHSNTETVTGGIDYFLNKHMAIGALGSYAYSQSRIPGIQGHLLANSMIGGLYGGAWTGNPGLYVSVAGLLNETDFSLLQTFSPRLVTLTGYGSIGYETMGKYWTWGPLASIQFDDTTTNGFSIASLQLHRNTTYALQSRVGARASLKIPAGGNHLKTQVQLMWERHYSGSAAIDVEFIGIPDSRTSIGKGAATRDSLWGSVSVDYRLSHGWSLQAGYSFDLGNQFISQQIDLGFHVIF